MICTGELSLDRGAGRNPDAAACPGAGRTVGCGPNLGLKAGFCGGGGALGLVDVTNCGFVKFKQVLNSTVKPRYWEHLSLSVTPDMNGTSHTTSIDLAFKPITTPFTERGTPPES